MTRFLGLRGTRLRSVISAVCGLCFLCFGYAQGVLGGLLTLPAFLERFPQIDTINNSSGYNAQLQGITMGTWNLGCFASAILTIFIGDYLGRRKTLLLGLAIWIIGEIVQCSSYSFGQFIAGRFIAGFGNGFTTSTVPAYQAECVKSHRKGTILMISAGAFIAAGLALSYWLVFAFAYVDTSATWRFPIAFQIVFALVAFVLLLFLPESPRWLILTGREQEALTVLAALNDEDIEGPEVRDEFLQIKDAILIMSQGSTSSMTNNKDRRNLHRVVLAYLVQVFQQMSGINLALQYLAIMFYTQMSYTGWMSRLMAGCASTEYFLASFIAVVGIDRFWGRRSLMIFGALGMCGSMVLLTVLGYLWHVHGVRGTNIAGTVFLFGFSTFFAIGWQGMAWLYQVEVVPLRIRGPANALSTSGNWLFNFIVVFITPIIFHNIGYRTYIIFACTNFIIVPLIYFLYPETAYRSLEEVDMLFQLANEAPGTAWLNVVRISQSEPLWYGKKGDVPFNYEKSAWHQRFTRFSGSGTTLGRSSENEKYNTPSGSDGTSPNAESQTRSNSNPQSEPSSGSTTMSNKPLHAHKNSGPLKKSSEPRTHNHRNESWQSARSDHSAYSAHSDPNWQESEMAPSPLRVPSRPTTAGSAKTGISRATEDTAVNYPGIIGGGHSSGYGTGTRRTNSGRDTYFPDGMEGIEGLGRPRRPDSSSQSSLSRFQPRDAGRGH